MRSLLLYNWEVRDEYFRTFEALPMDELIRDRKAGLGSILRTLFHIIDVEYSWMCAITGKPEVVFDVAQFNDLPSLTALSNRLRSEIWRSHNGERRKPFVQNVMEGYEELRRA